MLMQQVINDPQSQVLRSKLYPYLKAKQFFVAAHHLPELAVSGEQFILQKNAEIPLALAEGADGSLALLAYVDTATLQAQCPNSLILQLSGADVLNLVLAQNNLSALVVKAHIGWVGITKADVRFIVKGYAA